MKERCRESVWAHNLKNLELVYKNKARRKWKNIDEVINGRDYEGDDYERLYTSRVETYIFFNSHWRLRTHRPKAAIFHPLELFIIPWHRLHIYRLCSGCGRQQYNSSSIVSNICEAINPLLFGITRSCHVRQFWWSQFHTRLVRYRYPSLLFCAFLPKSCIIYSTPSCHMEYHS